MNTSAKIQRLMFAHNQLWVFHVQTKSYAEHKALGEAYELVQDFTDSYTERMLADEPIALDGVLMPLANYKTCECVHEPCTCEACEQSKDFIVKFIDFLEREISDSPDIINKRDELVFALRHVIYLLGLSE